MKSGKQAAVSVLIIGIGVVVIAGQCRAKLVSGIGNKRGTLQRGRSQSSPYRFAEGGASAEATGSGRLGLKVLDDKGNIVKEYPEPTTRPVCRFDARSGISYKVVVSNKDNKSVDYALSVE